MGDYDDYAEGPRALSVYDHWMGRCTCSESWAAINGSTCRDAPFKLEDAPRGDTYILNSTRSISSMGFVIAPQASIPAALDCRYYDLRSRVVRKPGRI